MKNIFNHKYPKQTQMALCALFTAIICTGTGGMVHALGKYKKHKQQEVALECMQKLALQSDSLLTANTEKIAWLEDEINIIKHIENKAVADSLATDRKQKQREILKYTQKFIDRNTRTVNIIAATYDIKLR